MKEDPTIAKLPKIVLDQLKMIAMMTKKITEDRLTIEEKKKIIEEDL